MKIINDPVHKSDGYFERKSTIDRDGNQVMTFTKNKTKFVKDGTEYKKYLYRNPRLRYIFLELTDSCNLHCRHCGSSCGLDRCSYLDTQEILRTIDVIAQNTSPSQTMFCITGGEPLLHPDWFAICRYIHYKGFHWGMTSNGTLIDNDMVNKLLNAGISTISISIDGTEKTHEKLRGVQGSYKAAINGIKLLIAAINSQKEDELRKLEKVEMTSVISPENIHELDTLYQLAADLGVYSWKLTGIEPIGRAKTHDELMLSQQQYKQLLDFVAEKRCSSPFKVTYGCNHLLPETYDDTVRGHRFLCLAGTMVASIASNGDIVACLDIDDRDRCKQGSILTDNFWNVWRKRFEMFRQEPKYGVTAPCKTCDQRDFCQGDSWHTWDFENGCPRLCLYHFLQQNDTSL